MLDFHPVAEIFPLMEGEQYDKLVQDIRDNSLLEWDAEEEQERAST